MNERMPPNTYEMDDLNPEQMALIDAWMEREALENRIVNNKNLIDRYECGDCGHEMFAATLAVGLTPLYASCDGCGGTETMTSGCFEPRIQRRYYTGPVHIEFFRPLTEDECRAARIALSAASTLNVLDHHLHELVARPVDADALMRACRLAGVKSMMDGHLLPRFGPDAR